MIRLRTATALAAGTIAALAIGGTALAAGGDDNPPRVDLLPNGDVVTTPTDDSSPSDDPTSDPSPSASSSSSPETSSSPEAGSSPETSTSPSGKSPGATSASGISIDAAKTIAIRVAGGGYVESVERETEHGRAVWDVDVIVGGVEHDIDVDRATGEVTRHRTKGSDDKGSNSGKSGDDNGRHGGRGADDDGGDNHGGHGSDD